MAKEVNMKIIDIEHQKMQKMENQHDFLTQNVVHVIKDIEKIIIENMIIKEIDHMNIKEEMDQNQKDHVKHVVAKNMYHHGVQIEN